jgi:hypothetical protein
MADLLDKQAYCLAGLPGWTMQEALDGTAAIALAIDEDLLA